MSGLNSMVMGTEKAINIKNIFVLIWLFYSAVRWVTAAAAN